MSRWLRVAALAALVLSARAAHAQRAAPEAVLLQVPDCFEVLASDVQQLVAIELAPRLRVTTDSEVPHALTASVLCNAGAPVELRVIDPQRASPLRSQLDLARTPVPARTRLLALTLSELIATARLERAAPEATAAQPPAQPKPAAAHATGSADKATEPEVDETDEDEAEESDPEEESATTATALDRLPLRVWLAPGLSRAFQPATTVFGVDGGVSYQLAGWRLGAELSGRWGNAALELADVSLRTYSAALAVGPVLTLGRVALHAGPGVRAGYVRLAAEAQRDGEGGDVLEGSWLGPTAVAAAELAVVDGALLRLSIEGGYAARAVAGHDSADDELMALRGPWFSTALGFALGLP